MYNIYIPLADLAPATSVRFSVLALGDFLLSGDNRRNTSALKEKTSVTLRLAQDQNCMPAAGASIDYNYSYLYYNGRITPRPD